ncbi:hypothetical protein TWF696_006581 [Orbilia brochopaga]|uniref:Uncharacterized protein n=1 Tax=Orbilia brochopaga TaxID=3140254 RepID=A0AAV9UXL2_9PEZI
MAPRAEPKDHENASASNAANRKRKRDVQAPKTARPSNPAPKDKRRKFQDAREISVQASEAAFCDGQFDVASFVSSREYEIKSLLRSMNSSRNAQRKRAFQSLPRELRRRTAAHNASRVPKRVRAIARAELVEDNTPPKKKRRDYRPNVRRLNAAQLRGLSQTPGDAHTKGQASKAPTQSKSRLPSKSSRYRKRQRQKTWLPTHIWCAKRARMICKWGFALAETPTLKCYRPTYRAASRESCIAFDTSYYATFLLEGQERDLKRCLMKFLPPRDLAVVGRHTISGETVASTWIYAERGWPVEAIAPIQIIWCPWYEGKVESDISANKCHRQRKIALRVHPAAWEEVWKVVTSCASSSKCTPRNLRFEIGSIRLVGPKATDILKTLVHSDTLKSDIFETSHLNNVVYETTFDPRLISLYVDKHGHPSIPPPSHEETKNATAHQRTVFDASCRHASVRAQVSQKTLNARVSKRAPGDSIAALSEAKIPVAIVKEMLGEKAHLSSSAGRELDSPDCWCIIMPWKWIRPFWLTLMRTKGVRFGGLKELEQLALEGKFGSYPIDFPATQAGRMEAVREHEETLDRIKRRSGMKVKATVGKNAGASPSGVEAEYSYPWDRVFRMAPAAESRSVGQCRLALWQLPPSLTMSLQYTSQDALPPSMSHAVFTAHVQLFGRGTVMPKAWVYSLPRRGTDAFKQLKLQYARDGKSTARILESSDGDDDQPEQEASSAEGAPESQGSPIGFVIRGNFGYSEGKPVAVAVLSWTGALAGAGAFEGSSGWCVLRNAEGGTGRLAQWNAV